ncbi:hypothetical protein RN001_012691 [Aquatica leii]|uniref:Kinesin-like protein n=1 Tax=Aquatica leii TaxID=1421715 RepID=A0AAN7SFA6_9COLE|nr:hypothetical protein RN001_012691 [Aquatica leii]
MSYISARDPSLPKDYSYTKVRINLAKHYDTCEDTSKDISEETVNNASENNIVLKKIKGVENLGELYEIKNDITLLCRVPIELPHASNVHENESITRTFKFSKIIGPNSNQTKLFDEVVKGKVLEFINGSNCTLMSYGASGSGKTFTIVGTSEEPGIIPRSLEYLFRTLPTLPEVPLIKPNASGGISYMTEADCLQDKMDRQILLSKHTNMDCALHKQTYKAMQERLSNELVGLIDQPLGPDVMLNVWVSFAEIYNENIYDLLKPHPCKGQSRQKLCLGNVNSDTYIKGLSSISVSSGLEAYLILQYGLHNTKYAATSVNSQSSRSHCVFTLKIAQASTTNKEEFVSVFNFCDLAGSERIKKTQNVGDRLKESNSINTSLLVLGRCIKLIRDNQKLKTSKVIPFRESKLTQLFQKALLGYESMWMIVNINTCREMFEETQHVLQFSAIAKDVIVEQQMLKACRTKRVSELLDTQIDKMNVKELQEQIAFLSDELKQQRLDNEKDREHVIRSYKAILEDTNKYWEKKIDELQCTLAETLRDVKHDIKTPEMSVIVLNSSSEENDNEDEENEGNVEDRLKDEIHQLQLKLKIQQDEMDRAEAESLDLDKILNEQKKSYLELKLKHETNVNLLKSKIIANDEKIKDLKKKIPSYTHLDNFNDISDKENVFIFGNQ